MRTTMLALLLLLVALGCTSSEPQAESVGEPAPSAPAAATPAGTPPATPPKTASAPPPPPPAAPAIDPEALAVVRGYTQMFYRGELDLLHQKFSEEMQTTLPLDQFSALYEHVITNYGKETMVIGEDSRENEDYRAFVRWARFDKTEEIIEVQWILRADSDVISGFFIRPAQRKIRADGK